VYGRPARIERSQPSGVAVMGSFSLMHWIVVLAIILILFGAGKLPRVMGDFAKGIKAFKAGMKEEDEAETTPAAQVPPPTAAASTAAPAGVVERPREHA
jgi:sec-independent protein translocase protein TatA